jgi:uncharacterized protein YkwD
MKLRYRLLVSAAATLVVGGVVAGVVALEPVAAPLDTTAPTSGPLRADAPPKPTATPSPTPAPPAPAPPAPAPPAPQPPLPADPVEAQVISIVNAERAANGCGPVAADEGLAAVARAHSADMVARDFFSHVNPDGLDPFERAAAAGQSARAENIAAGQPDATAVMAAWMGSSGHRANILNCGLTRLGVGVGHGGSYGITWTQLFG